MPANTDNARPNGSKGAPSTEFIRISPMTASSVAGYQTRGGAFFSKIVLIMPEAIGVTPMETTVPTATPTKRRLLKKVI